MSDDATDDRHPEQWSVPNTRGLELLDTSTASDAALAIAMGRWDEAALEEVYRRHGGAVHALARRVLRDGSLAQEVTQEIFVRLWHQPERFDPERGSLRAFLLAQAHRRAVDVVRSEEARRRREERDAEGEVRVNDGLDRELMDLTMAERVRDALEQLPHNERVAIELAYFGGQTYREVAEALRAPEGTVKSRIRSGLLRLREALVESGVDG